VISHECREGRLVEIRIASPFDLDQAHELGALTAQFYGRRSGRFISVVDMRGVEVLAPDVADDLLVNLRRANRRIERTAVLLPTSPTVALQVERLHREAGNPARHTFKDAISVTAFLDDVLSDDEKHALARFLT